MEREVKFRAWDGKKMWPSINVVVWDNCFYLNESGTLNDPDKPYSASKLKGHSVRNSNVMQFTGLKDKNGKEIYEGDVVNCRTKGKYQYPHQGKVEYLGQGENYYCGYFAINCGEFDGETHYTHFWDNEEFFVIGNIYENPEYGSTGRAHSMEDNV